MIGASGRDTAAMFALDQLLSQAREEYIIQALSGQPLDQTYWPAREAQAKLEIQKRFYNPKVQAAVNPTAAEPDPADSDSPSADNTMVSKDDPEVDSDIDQGAFDQHGQKLVEHAIWMTHEILKQIPFVGQMARGDH